MYMYSYNGSDQIFILNNISIFLFASFLTDIAYKYFLCFVELHIFEISVQIETDKIKIYGYFVQLLCYCD